MNGDAVGSRSTRIRTKEEFVLSSPGYNVEIESVRKTEFRNLTGVTYLDHAGATIYAQSQIENFSRDLTGNLYGNPHSLNSSSRLTTDTVDQIKSRVLELFGTDGDRHGLIFTSGCTAALKLVAECFDWSNEGGGRPAHFCYLEDNHTSVVGMRAVAADKHVSVHPVAAFDLESKVRSGHELLDNNNPSGEAVVANGLVANDDGVANSLFAYPAQSNFSGRKYPLSWCARVKKHGIEPWSSDHCSWRVVLDAASLVSTSPLDLSRCQADFTTCSFYKIFGFPTGLGALIVRKDCESLLLKRYFGGGTLLTSSSTQDFHVLRPGLSQRFEDGTVSFLDILALKYGLEAINSLGGGMPEINRHTFQLAKYTYQRLTDLKHFNGSRVVEMYVDTTFDSPDTQGPIINFNLLKPDGSYIGFAEVDRFAEAYDIHLRTGCFCNMGACQKFLGLTTQIIQQNFQAGKVCGDSKDIINGRPTGSIRVSFGYMSTFEDTQRLLTWINECVISLFNRATLSKRNSREEEEVPSQMANSDGDRFEGSVLTDIFLYPIKSCAAMKVESWRIGATGLEYDRQWMVVNSTGICLNQKREPRLCLVSPCVDTECDQLVLSAPGIQPLRLPLNTESSENAAKICHSRVCADRVEAFDCGDEAADWLTAVLGQSCRLVKFNPSKKRHTKLKQEENEGESALIAMANQSQFLLINRPTVRDLILKIQQSDLGTDLKNDMNEDNLVSRFRANLVVTGQGPYQEERWEKLQIGSVPFQCVGTCSRCQMICIDQNSGRKSREPLHTLAQHRDAKVPFGIHLEAKPINAKIQVGDIVAPQN